ncbi:MAG TPA: GAF domain-containing protein [Anaerolineae bacterium]|nr:GAF domain-containing protein [Anaerolineae bacterium]
MSNEQLRDLKRIHALAEVCALAHDEDELWREAARIASQLVPADNFGLALVENLRRRLLVKNINRWGQNITPLAQIPTIALGQGITGEVAATGQPLLINDVRVHSNYVAADPATLSELCVPIKVDGQVVGVINAESHQLNAFTARDLQLLVTAAYQLGMAVANLRLVQAYQQRVEQLAMLHATQLDIAAESDLDILLETIVERAMYLLRAESGALYLTVPDIHAVRCVVSLGSQKDYTGEILAYGEGVAGVVANTNEALLIPHYGKWAYRSKSAAEQDWDTSVMAAPMVWQNHTVGVLLVANHIDHSFDKSDTELLAMSANQAAMAVQTTQLLTRARRRALELESLLDLSSALRYANTVLEMLPYILVKVSIVVEDSVHALYLIDDEQEHFVWVGAHSEYYDWMVLLDYEQMRSDEQYLEVSTFFPPVWTDPIPNGMPNYKNSGVTLFDLPLLAQASKQGSTVGILRLVLPTKRRFHGYEDRLLRAIVEIASAAVSRARVMETLEQRVTARTQDLAMANEQLQELDRLKSKFMDDMVHELRTPVTNVSLYLDLLVRGKASRREHYVEVLQKETQRLAGLIEETLNLSRLDLGKITLEFGPVNLNYLLAELFDLLRPRAEEQQLQLRLVERADLPLVWGDEGQLRQLFNYLVTNAILYTPEGQVMGRFIGGEGATQIGVEIIDTGVGLAEDEIAHIFTRFYRGRYAGQSNIPGYGLGLAIALEVIKLHGGRIEVDSVEGEGSIFRAWLWTVEGYPVHATKQAAHEEDI